MILVLLTYTVAPEIVLDHRDAHVAWLKVAVEDGRLLAAGRKATRDGGMLMARGTLDEVTAWAANDPYALAGIATYQFVEIDVSLTAPGLEPLKP